MQNVSGEPVDIWKRLKRLTKDRNKICARINRLNLSISHRTNQLSELGARHAKLTFAIDRVRDDLSEEQIQAIARLITALSKRIDKLTRDVADLSDPSIELFAELEEVDNEINALKAIVEARPDNRQSPGDND